jgi:hypothetical protein
MAIVADVYDLSAAEFLLMLSLNRKSGRLEGVNGEHRVMVAFQNGSIVYAGSTAVTERLGSILVSRNLVTEEQLQSALRVHKESEKGTLLGNVLVEMGAITSSALAEVVGGQFQKVVEELLSWPDGQLTFNRMEIPDLGAVHVDPREMLVSMGFDTEQLVLGSMSTLEDSSRDAEAREREAQQAMRTMMQEMQNLSVALTAEATLEVLSGAREVVDRGVLLLVAADSLRGIGGFGVEVEGLSVDEVVRNCEVPRNQASVFTWVIENGRAYNGVLEYNPVHGLFVDQLGGAKPEDVAVVPLIYGSVVVAVFYGDTAPENRPIELPARLGALMKKVAAGLEQ